MLKMKRKKEKRMGWAGKEGKVQIIFKSKVWKLAWCKLNRCSWGMAPGVKATVFLRPFRNTSVTALTLGGSGKSHLYREGCGFRF